MNKMTAPTPAMPEQPQAVSFLRGMCSEKNEVIVYIDELRAYATNLREENERLSKDAERLKFLHQCTQTDQDGYEWGVFRVKWWRGNPESVLATLADSSDLDKFIALCNRLQTEYGSQFTDSISGLKNAAKGEENG
jgi:hypothetical protein